MKPFEEYKKEVLAAYQKRKDEGSLPLGLKQHTPASIKRECINEFPSRYTEKYTETFKMLLGPANSAEEYYQKIRDADPDIFRPLNNFLKGNTENTHDRNIYLLAWLIDFEPEPDNVEPEVITPTTDHISLSVRIINWTRKTVKGGRATYIIALLIVIGVIIYYTFTKPRYMYWNGNEYKPLAYYQDKEGLIIIKLDTFRLRHLKKITDLKLITRNSIGKVHYSSIRKEYQFYTIGGENPDDTARRLLPMTEYIYRKYVLKKP